MTVESLATRLGPLDEMRGTPAARSFTLAVWRVLRDTGAPLNRTTLDELASEASLDQPAATALIERYAELDAGDNVVGLSGLSIADHPHRIELGDRTLTAWCAWDPFFLVPVLGGSAIVNSTDPHTGAPVRLTFEDGRVTQATPSGAVISIVVPTPRDDDAPGSTVEELWATF
jgi:alkylmercury lyase-like protein